MNEEKKRDRHDSGRRRKSKKPIPKPSGFNQVMTSPWAIGAVAVIGISLLTWFIVSPYHASSKIQKAIGAGNESLLLDYTEPTLIQKNMAQRFQAELQNDIQTQNKQSRFYLLGETMAPLMVDREAWQYSQRKSIIATIQHGKMIKNEDILYLEKQQNSLSWQKKYKGINEFWLTASTGQSPVTLKMRRVGLTGWKVVDLLSQRTE